MKALGKTIVAIGAASLAGALVRFGWKVAITLMAGMAGKRADAPSR